MKAATALLLLLTALATAAAPDETTEKEISHLLSHLGSSGCQFSRNGTWYDSTRAVSHLNRKYEYLLTKNMISSTESFIELAASESSSSKKPYLVKCGAEPETVSATWFRDELARYRSKT